MRKRIIAVIAAVCLLAVPFTVYGLRRAENTPEQSIVPYSSQIVDRMNISVDSTKFVYAPGADGDYEFSFVLTVSKAEPDFYGRIDRLDVTGGDYTSLVFEALGSTPDGSVPDGLVLAPGEYKWRVTGYCEKIPEDAALVLVFTSGFTSLTSEQTEKKIPLSFLVSPSDAGDSTLPEQILPIS